MAKTIHTHTHTTTVIQYTIIFKLQTCFYATHIAYIWLNFTYYINGHSQSIFVKGDVNCHHAHFKSA